MFATKSLLPPTTNADREFAKSLLCFADAAIIYNGHHETLDTTHGTTQQDNNEPRISILPPWQCEDDMAGAESTDVSDEDQGSYSYSYNPVEDDMVVSEAEATEEDICDPLFDLSEEYSLHLSIKSVQWSQEDLTSTIESNNANDDDLSLYLGAEYQLTEGFYDLSTIIYEDVKHIITQPEKQCIFPKLLHDILSSGKYDDSIVWLPHGRAFVITDGKKFFAEVAPWYFCIFEDELFMRWIEAYGLQQVEYQNQNGTTSVAFYHESFLRSRPWLAVMMKEGAIPRATQSVNLTQQIFQSFDLVPSLQDVPVPVSFKVRAHQLPMIVAFDNYLVGQRCDGNSITMTES